MTDALANAIRSNIGGMSNGLVGQAKHAAGVERLLASFRAIPPEQRVRLAKRTSNLFRRRSSAAGPGLDTSGLVGVVSVDPEAQTADVQGMCTYEDLVDAVLPYGFMPYVVPQLKTITLGGAVTGLGIESTSFSDGLPHESVTEMDVLTGTGEIVTARPDGTERERALFKGFPNSYGSLGYAVRLRIRLRPAPDFVALRHYRFASIEALTAAVQQIMDSKIYDGTSVDFLDGVVFSASEMYLTLGEKINDPAEVPEGPQTPSRYDGIGDKQAIYYRSMQHDAAPAAEAGKPAQPKRDLLRIRDYLWRWDTDWFWCSRAFGAQNPAIRRVWPQQLLRSSFYWKIVAADHRWDLGDRLSKLKGEPPRERVVQDVEVTLDRLPEFITWFLREVPEIQPLWLCPLELSTSAEGAGDHERPWPLYPLAAGTPYVNVGFWSSAPKYPGWTEGAWNRKIEDEVSALGGHKSLYSEAFYDEATFDTLYGGERAAQLKAEFDLDNRFPTLYDKAVRAQ